ncbi:hypothetical protein F5B20DRAFT_578929 [Whalleya microplaca]|nr:hypothetical protein F5B20DRAFT_578929 [Whalleya microplaca]
MPDRREPGDGAVCTDPEATPITTEIRKPRTRQRLHKAPPTLAVPNINDDAAERKRVLNVLAQRRYRERRREAKSRSSVSTKDVATASGGVNRNDEDDVNENTPNLILPQSEDSVVPTSLQLALNAPLPVNKELLGTGSILDSGPQLAWSTTAVEPTMPDLTEIDENFGAFDSSREFSAEQLQSFLIGDKDDPFQDLTTVEPTTPLDFPTNPPGSGLSLDEVETLSFPDSYLLPVNERTLMRAFLRIGARIGCTSSFWDIASNSPFNDGTHTALSAQQLPPTWQPTPSQRSMPHHPVIDFLPWPGVRDRLLMILCLPDAVRPPAAAGPLALTQFAYDMEDSAEGIRIWGGDPCESSSWEVGQVLFERWWFLFDRKIVEQSNHWRDLRGAAALTMRLGPGKGNG